MEETAGSADAENQSKSEAVEGQALAKIEPVKIATSEVQDAEVTETETRGMEINEAALLDATRTLLRSYGVRKSAAAVREAVETPHDTFAPAQAVSALSSLGFKSSFGSLKLEKLGPEFFPLIAFARDGNAIVLHGPIEEERVRVSQFGSKGKIETISSDTVTSTYAGYVILAVELNDGEKEQRKRPLVLQCIPQE